MTRQGLLTSYTVVLGIIIAQAGCRSTPVRPQTTAARPVVYASTVSVPAGPTASDDESRVVPASLVQVAFEEAQDLPDPVTIELMEIGPDAMETVSDDAEFGLSDAIARAMAMNPDLVSAIQQLASADATLARARAEFYPTLGVSEQYGVSNNPVTAFMFQLNQRQLNPVQDFNQPPTTDNFQTQLQFQHNLYSGGRRKHQMHAASAKSQAAAGNLVALRNQLVFRVAEAYYRVLQARDLAGVRREAVTQVEQHLKIVETRFRNETAVKSDVLMVEVRLAEVQESLITAENQLKLGWAVLENVIGGSVQTRRLPDAIPSAPWSEEVQEIEMAVAAASNERAEIGSMANQRQAAAEGILSAKSGKRLGVDLVTQYDVFTGDFQRGADSFFAGVVLRMNLFDGGRTRTEIARAVAQFRELQSRERRLMLDIELDVRRAYLQLQDARARLEVAARAIEQGRESLREIEVRYRGQTATITQLIDAQVALSNTRVRRTTAEADVEIARAALQRAMGRLEDLASL